MFNRLRNFLWGDLSNEEFTRFGMLSVIPLLILGTYWIMKPLKESIFIKMVGKLYLPYVKMASFIFIIPLILVYSQLIDLIEKQKLFYVICSFYTICFVGVALLLQHPTIGLANPEPHPTRLLGWALYLIIESFGSLVLALFWSFVASTTKTESAKKGYMLIIAGAQIGTIIGPIFATNAKGIGIPALVLMIAVGILLIPLWIKLFISKYPDATNHETKKVKKRSGPIEGLKLLLTKPYLIGVLGVSTLNEIVSVIVEYQMLFLADSRFTTPESFTKFMGFFGLTVNITTLCISLLGTSFLIRKFGLTFCLAVFPILVGLTVGYVWAMPTLWVVCGATILIKCLSYALNNPCKEIMYIPTSKDIKFKAKSWIDMFGIRGAKAAGSGVNAFFTQASRLLFFAPLICMGVAGFWTLVAIYVGSKNKQLTDNDQIIE